MEIALIRQQLTPGTHRVCAREWATPHNRSGWHGKSGVPATDDVLRQGKSHMSAEATVTPLEKEPKGKKRSLVKLVFLVMNVLLFLSGAGFFALTKFGILNKPAAVAPTEAPAAEAHDDHAAPPAKDKDHGKDKGHGKEAGPAKDKDHGKDKGHGKEAGHAKDKGHGKDKGGGGHGGGHGGKSAKKGEPVEELVTVQLQPFVVNLSGDQGRRYLRLVLQLEVEGEDAKAEIEGNLAQLRDRLIFLLSSKTADEISNVQGKYQLQGEITKGVNDLLRDPVVERVYFTEFIMQ